MTHIDGILHTPITDIDHSIGPVNAALTLLEYGDYECPFCRQAQPIVEQILAALNGRVRFVFRNFPLAEIHAHAMHAAEAAESVGAQSGPEAFWAMHDTIFEHQRDSADALDDAHLGQYAADVGVDPDVVRQDLDAARFTPNVRADFIGGVRSGVNGTPTFFVNGSRFDGDWTDRLELLTALEFHQVVS
jgi:protein-disulfide isomerase